MIRLIHHLPMKCTILYICTQEYKTIYSNIHTCRCVFLHHSDACMHLHTLVSNTLMKVRWWRLSFSVCEGKKGKI